MEIFTCIMMLLAGCGVFMIGMKMMSDGLERSAGKEMKKLFNHVTGNRFAGVGIGALVTVIVNSSSASTVMTIGLVNAGVITLTQAASIIMGANIGTTLSGFIISLSSLNINLYASLLAFIGIMMTFFNNDNVKKTGGILCGLGLMFVGLESMGSAFSGESAITDSVKYAFEVVDFPLLLILIGMAFTGIIQSSTATTSLVIIMVGAGAMRVDSGLFVILGTNIGTCVTALIASIGTNTNSRRTAFFHLLFNVIGTVIFTIVIWIFRKPVVSLLSHLGGPQWQIAWFHFAFNLITTAILLPFINQFVRLTELIVRDKPAKKEEEFRFRYIDDRLLSTPPIAVAQVQKEIMYASELAKENLELSAGALIRGDYVNRQKLEKNESYINRIYHGVVAYLIKLASTSLSEHDEKLVGAYHHVISDLERIGDHAENFAEQAAEMEKENVTFSDAANAELLQMYNKVMNMYDLSLHAFEHRDYVVLSRISAIENEVDEMKDDLSVKHIERLNSGDCAVERGTYFFALISALERIADHLINVAYSIKNPTGSQSRRPELNEVSD